MSSGPHVSVIVPVLNDPRGIAVCSRALLAQTYPPHQYEVVVVDNGSTDDTRAAVERLCPEGGGRLRLVIETERRSSYAARNRALGAVRGEIVAFTDADCTPTSTWLEHGVRALEAQGGGSVAGRVDFTYRGERPNVYEYWDSAVHMNQADLIRRFHFGATANLFTYARMFQLYGPFRADLASGGDREFGHRLYLAGEPLAYAADAVVRHPARADLGTIFEKSLRVARAPRGLHRSGVLSSRKRCARRLKVLRTCPQPGSWEGNLPRHAMETVLLLRNLDAWLAVAVCLGQSARDRAEARLAAARNRWRSSREPV
jgi:glycosyltransferase involved in cell wall biosynthesis